MLYNNPPPTTSVQDTADILSQTRELLNSDDMYGQDAPQSSQVQHNQQIRPNIQAQAQQTGVQQPHIQRFPLSAPGIDIMRPNTHPIPQFVRPVNSELVYGNSEQSVAPGWLANMLHGFERRWATIEGHLESQDRRWQNVSMQMEDQNKRMGNIEQQLTQISELRESVTQTQIHITKLDTDLSNTKSKIYDCDKSVNFYSNLCDKIVSTSAETDSKVNYLMKKVETLELNQNTQIKSQAEIQAKQLYSEDKLLDLQWRSMRQNLIFTGLCEPALPFGVNENVEDTLRQFLSCEMQIDTEIRFDRVHRLGRPRYNQTNPRPIIARFEKYKDKEFVRLAAPKCLAGKRYGVREQFPPEIEEQRKLLYPIAKEYRQNKNNVVKLVRDKLYVNGREIIVDNISQNETGGTTTNTQTDTRQRQQPWRKTAQPNLYRPNKPLFRQQQNPQQQRFFRKNEQAQTKVSHQMSGSQNATNLPKSNIRQNTTTPVAWQLPTSNAFQVLGEIDSESGITGPPYLNKQTYGKKKPTSPLDSDLSYKKRKDADFHDNEFQPTQWSETPMETQHMETENLNSECMQQMKQTDFVAEKCENTKSAENIKEVTIVYSNNTENGSLKADTNLATECNTTVTSPSVSTFVSTLSVSTPSVSTATSELNLNTTLVSKSKECDSSAVPQSVISGSNEKITSTLIASDTSNSSTESGNLTTNCASRETEIHLASQENVQFTMPNSVDSETLYYGPSPVANNVNIKSNTQTENHSENATARDSQQTGVNS
ncbi:MAG: hypothetical protein AB2693_01300 [Candidatus Thiodiazotropha sp.]